MGTLSEYLKGVQARSLSVSAVRCKAAVSAMVEESRLMEGPSAVGDGSPVRISVADFAKRMVPMGPTEFTRDVMRGTAMVLENGENPLRLNLFAVSIRIFLDHLMDALAPREQVEACRWFEFVAEQDKPTRKQRLAYGLHGGFTSAEVKELTGIDVDELLKEVVDAYGELNKHVHGREDTIVRDIREQDAIADDVLGALAGLMEAQRDCRSEIVDAIADSLQSETVQKFTTETVEKLDILATHHTVDWVGVDEQRVLNIDATHVEYEITGSLGVTLLYGSGSDRRSGEGAEMSDEFPISLRFRVPVEEPHNLALAEITGEVDTSAWYGSDDDEDVRHDGEDWEWTTAEAE
jgi:hypothetical protein